MYSKSTLILALVFCQSLLSQIQTYNDGQLYGIKDLKGNDLILPIFSEVIRSGEDTYAVKANEKWGLLNYAGEYISECIYDSIYPFKNSICRVKFNELYGYLDKFGTPITETVYKRAHNFEAGYARVQLKDKWGIINSNGKYIVLPVFETISRKVNKITLVQQNKRYGLLGDHFQSISNNHHTKYKWFSATHIALFENSSATLYNTSGQRLRTFNGSELMPFSKSSLRLKQNDLWGIIGFDGSWTIPPSFTTIGSLNNQMARIKDGELYGFINQDAEIVFPPQYPNATEFSKGLAKVQIGNSWKWINTKGKIILTDDDITIQEPKITDPAIPQEPQIAPNAELETLDALEKVRTKNNRIQRASEIIYYYSYPGYFYRPYYRQRIINHCRPIISYYGSDWTIRAGGCEIQAAYNKPLHLR
ncbi:MAG: WG repeat-containing protein [Lentisphaerales bacterium]|nr:WG repeat-containing protein [Lentisphaerales bacterium]